MSIMQLLWELPIKLIALLSVMWNFLFTEISIGTLDVSVWGLVGGAGLVALIIVSLVRG